MATQPDISAPIQEAIDDFRVALDVFEGPFDLLLQLIARKSLDITEVALAEVTDEFMEYMRIFPDLSKTTEFLVVAATLLEVKSASLLPRTEIDENRAIEDLEARDILFTRLLQYRAFKGASQVISSRLDEFAGYVPRSVALEPHFAALLPELLWTVHPEDFAICAARAIAGEPELVTTHLHDPVVPVREQAILLAERLKNAGRASFHDLVADAASQAVIVSRFLAVLELYRRCVLDVVQDEPLAELILVWRGGEDTVVDGGTFDDEDADTSGSDNT